MASEGKNLVGVDIGSHSIKVCEVKEGRRGSYQLSRFAYHPLPPEAVVDGQVMDPGSIIEGLEKIFHKSKRRNIAMRASGHSVIIKKITMPLMTSQELSEQIVWEAEQHIPFDLQEVHVDHQVLRRRPDEGQMDVLLVAAKREEIADLTHLAVEARLKPVVVDLDAFAVQNVYEAAFGEPRLDDTVVLVHVGASLTTINIISEGSTSFTRDIASGGNLITEEIRRELNISREEAEAYKCGGDGRGIVPKEVPEITDRVVEQLADEIQRSLDFYVATSGARDITRICMSGGTANLRSMLTALHRKTRVPVDLLAPLKVAVPDPRLVDPLLLEGRSAQAAVAVGLALRKEKEKGR
jgi:type IV pilus assembly protein PilM